MALNRIIADSIADGTVIASDIADGTITLAKLQSGLLPPAIANSAASYANAAFTTANNAFTSTNGTIAWATANSSASYANSAFLKANTTVTAANGGTGLTTLTANNVVLGNGTSAVQFVSPGTNGNLLTSDGTTWTSAAPPASGVTSLNGQTGAVTTTNFDGIGSCAILVSAQTSDTAVGGTIAGSSLRYNLSTTNGNGAPGGLGFFGYISNSNSYGGGGTAVSGTWRKMYGMPNWNAVAVCAGTNYYFYSALWMRIS